MINSWQIHGNYMFNLSLCNGHGHHKLFYVVPVVFFQKQKALVFKDNKRQQEYVGDIKNSVNYLEV